MTADEACRLMRELTVDIADGLPENLRTEFKTHLEHAAAVEDDPVGDVWFGACLHFSWRAKNAPVLSGRVLALKTQLFEAA